MSEVVGALIVVIVFILGPSLAVNATWNMWKRDIMIKSNCAIYEPTTGNFKQTKPCPWEQP